MQHSVGVRPGPWYRVLTLQCYYLKVFSISVHPKPGVYHHVDAGAPWRQPAPSVGIACGTTDLCLVRDLLAAQHRKPGWSVEPTEDQTDSYNLQGQIKVISKKELMQK